jgi:uncharacterized protein YdeI (YjbR/CyaY-like superfamily)
VVAPQRTRQLKMPKPSSYEIFATRAEWRGWLEAHYADQAELWLAVYKKGSGKTAVTYEEAVEEALCYGWIDGLVQAIDEDKYAVRFSPRKPGSIWAESNKRRVEKLIREGRMAEPGLQKVAAAKASGEWEAAARREEIDALPPELDEALRAQEGALAGFQALPASRRKGLIWWLSDAKRNATREKRLRAIIDEALIKSKRA